jgi:hypothetical protein
VKWARVSLRVLAAGHSWHWWVLYAVPLVPLWFLCSWLWPSKNGWWWAGWFIGLFTFHVAASRMERRYWQ